jgi:hypothetical protein
LFNPEAQLTDPIAFLRRLRQKSKYRAGRSRALLARLTADLNVWLGWDVDMSLDRNGEFEANWQASPAWRRSPVIVALDIARHLFDASAHLDGCDLFQQPGVVLLDQPEVWCAAGLQADFFKLLDALFPKLQLFVSLSPQALQHFPARLLEHGLDIPEPQPRRRPVPTRHLPHGTILLVDVERFRFLRSLPGGLRFYAALSARAGRSCSGPEPVVRRPRGRASGRTGAHHFPTKHEEHGDLLIAGWPCNTLRCAGASTTAWLKPSSVTMTAQEWAAS